LHVFLGVFYFFHVSFKYKFLHLLTEDLLVDMVLVNNGLAWLARDAWQELPGFWQYDGKPGTLVSVQLYSPV